MAETRQLTRTFDLRLLTREEADEASKDGFRRVKATLSTDNPYKRWPDGYEVLVHGKPHVDTERLDDGFPILYNHQRSQIVGKLLDYELTDKQLDVTMEIGGSAAADDTIRMLDAGILSKMSVSYEYDWDNASVEEVGDEEYVVRLMRWMPIEGSFVSIPADNKCDVNSVREHLTATGKLPEKAKKESEEQAEEKPEITDEDSEREKSPVSDPQSTPEGDVAPDHSTNEEAKQMSDQNIDTTEIVKQERERTAAISTLCRENDIDAATESRFISEGVDAGTAALEVVNILKQRKAEEAAKAEKAKAEQPQEQVREVRYDTSVNAPMPATRQHNYNLRRALSFNIQELDGLELEVHQELRRQRAEEKRPTGANAVLVPGYELARVAFSEGKRHMAPQARADIQAALDAERKQRDLTLAGTGTGNTSAAGLNPDELIPSAFIEMLRNYSNLGELGVTMLEGLVGDVKLPRQTGKETWSYSDGASPLAGASDTAASLPKTTTPSFDNLTLSMKTAYARQGISRAALMNTAPAVFSLVVNSVIVGASETLQNTLINGTGTGSPTGIFNTTGISGEAIATDGVDALTVAIRSKVEAKLRSSNVFRPNSMETGKWLIPGDSYSFLEAKQEYPSSASAKTIIEDGKIGNSPVMWWNGMPDKKGLYANWSDALVGVWGDSIEFRTADHENGGVVLSAYMDHDIKLRHATSFVQVAPTV